MTLCIVGIPLRQGVVYTCNSICYIQLYTHWDFNGLLYNPNYWNLYDVILFQVQLIHKFIVYLFCCVVTVIKCTWTIYGRRTCNSWLTWNYQGMVFWCSCNCVYPWMLNLKLICQLIKVTDMYRQPTCYICKIHVIALRHESIYSIVVIFVFSLHCY